MTLHVAASLCWSSSRAGSALPQTFYWEPPYFLLEHQAPAPDHYKKHYLGVLFLDIITLHVTIFLNKSLDQWTKQQKKCLTSSYLIDSSIPQTKSKVAVNAK